AAVKEWYEQESGKMTDLVRENELLNESQRSRYESSQPQDIRNYEKYRQSTLASEMAYRDAAKRTQTNFRVIVRLQQGLGQVRNGLSRLSLHFDWFKIPNGTGFGSY